MPMGNIQKQKFQAWLAANMPQHPAPCLMCRNTTWDFGEVIDVSGVSGVIAPMVQLVCQTCGYIVLFDAKKSRVV